MLIVKILAIAGGAFLNRVRGGLFDFCGNKLLFPLFCRWRRGVRERCCARLLPLTSASSSAGELISALCTGSRPTQAEVPQIDEIVNSVKFTFKGKTVYLSEYPRVWGFAALALRGLMWSFFIGLALQSVPVMVCGVLMPVCYALTGFLDRMVIKKGGKTAWNLGEWLWGAVLTAFVLW